MVSSFRVSRISSLENGGAKVPLWVLLYSIPLGLSLGLNSSMFCEAKSSFLAARDVRDNSIPKEKDEPQKEPSKGNRHPDHSVADRRISDLRPAEPSPLLDPYEVRKGPGPEHGGDPHGDDPHDEIHKDPYGGTAGNIDDAYAGSTSNNVDKPNRPY